MFIFNEIVLLEGVREAKMCQNYCMTLPYGQLCASFQSGEAKASMLKEYSQRLRL